MESDDKPLFWIGSTRRDLREFPEEARRACGYALRLAQQGKKHPDAKPLKGFSGAGVLEVVGDHGGDTYRAVYTVRFAGAIYALHAFQKKAKHGIKCEPTNNSRHMSTAMKKRTYMAVIVSDRHQ
jgi:phage-related protein